MENEKIIEFGKIKLKQLTDKMDKSFTALFELCTPMNRVVVPHKDFQLYFLSMKHNDSGLEILDDPFEGMFPLPKYYPMSNLEQIVKAAEELPFNDEGYVVVDEHLNRVKIKSPAYVKVHHMSNNGVISETRVLDLIRTNEHTEFLNYYPEYQDFFDGIERRLEVLKEKLGNDQATFITWDKENLSLSRKEKAKYILDNMTMPAIHFQYLDEKISTWQEYVKNIPSDKLISLI